MDVERLSLFCFGLQCSKHPDNGGLLVGSMGFMNFNIPYHCCVVSNSLPWGYPRIERLRIVLKCFGVKLGRGATCRKIEHVQYGIGYIRFYYRELHDAITYCIVP